MVGAKHLSWLGIAALTLGVAACYDPPPNDTVEAERLMKTSREWSKAAEAGDMEAVLRYFADDAILISASQPPVRGRKAIRDYLAGTSKIPGFRIRWEPIEAKVSGDVGYMLERTHVTMTGPEGAPVSEELQAVTVWRKQPDGSWKTVGDASVPAAPARVSVS